jgi:hypothetical protein
MIDQDAANEAQIHLSRIDSYDDATLEMLKLKYSSFATDISTANPVYKIQHSLYAECVNRLERKQEQKEETVKFRWTLWPQIIVLIILTVIGWIITIKYR